MTEEKQILDEAVREVSETGALSFPARRRLWLAMGPYEGRPEDDPVPRALTEPLRRRAELALACAKKVSRVWCAYDGADKRPQALLKAVRAYLDGKDTAAGLARKGAAAGDFWSIVDEEPDSSAPAAALAAWGAFLTALHDEPLLEPRYAGASDADLDPYDWDAAREASAAWAGADEEAGPGKRRVRRMQFWAWYLEEAAKLLGREDFRFPARAVKAFREKQDPPKPVPAAVTLESLADYLGLGEVRYCCRVLAKKTLYDEREPLCYHIVTRRQDTGGACPVCGAWTEQFSHVLGGNAAEGDLPGGVHFMVVDEVPFFRCPAHPKEWCGARQEPVNRKALYKKYSRGPGRAEALLAQLETRAVYRFAVTEHAVTLNGRAIDRFMLHILNGGTVPGLTWTDRTDDSFAVDLASFGPHVAFLDLPYAEFAARYPERVKHVAERMTEIAFDRVWARCYLDGAGALARLETTNRFRVQLRDPKGQEASLALGLQRALGMAEGEAKARAAAQGQSKYAREREEMDCLSGLSRAEAERVLAVLRGCGVTCRIMPWRIDEEGDAW